MEFMIGIINCVGSRYLIYYISCMSEPNGKEGERLGGLILLA